MAARRNSHLGEPLLLSRGSTSRQPPNSGGRLPRLQQQQQQQLRARLLVFAAAAAALVAAALVGGAGALFFARGSALTTKRAAQIGQKWHYNSISEAAAAFGSPHGARAAETYNDGASMAGANDDAFAASQAAVQAAVDALARAGVKLDGVQHMQLDRVRFAHELHARGALARRRAALAAELDAAAAADAPAAAAAATAAAAAAAAATEAGAAPTPTTVTTPPPPPRRGVVVVVGSRSMWANALVAVSVLKGHLKSRLPVEVVHYGARERDALLAEVMERTFGDQGVRVVDGERAAADLSHHATVELSNLDGVVAAAAPSKDEEEEEPVKEEEGEVEGADATAAAATTAGGGAGSASRRPRRRPIRGFAAKAHALAYATSFEQALLIDCDNVPLVDPAELFDSPEFIDGGALFWPDFFRRAWLEPALYRRVVAPALLAGKSSGSSSSSDGSSSSSSGNSAGDISAVALPWDADASFRQAESGQVLLDRRRHADVLEWLWWLNAPEHSNVTYAHMLGDKDSYRLAFALAGKGWGGKEGGGGARAGAGGENHNGNGNGSRTAAAAAAPGAFRQVALAPRQLFGYDARVHAAAGAAGRPLRHAGMVQHAPGAAQAPAFLHRTGPAKLFPHCAAELDRLARDAAAAAANGTASANGGTAADGGAAATTAASSGYYLAATEAPGPCGAQLLVTVPLTEAQAMLSMQHNLTLALPQLDTRALEKHCRGEGGSGRPDAPARCPGLPEGRDVQPLPAAPIAAHERLERGWAAALEAFERVRALLRAHQQVV